MMQQQTTDQYSFFNDFHYITVLGDKNSNQFQRLIEQVTYITINERLF